MQITTREGLLTVLEEIEGCRAVAIDTEFMREKTYYPLLCLVQVATDECEFLIDPLAVGDLKPLGTILADPRTLKVFHAGLQDRELLYQNTGTIPAPVFDTQTAAPLLGLPQQVGYAAAVQEFCNVKLKKLDGLTDWSRRPLTNGQVAYSLEDVRYLLPMYDKMCAALAEAGRLHWLDEEFARMSDPAVFEHPDSELWHKVRKANSLPRKQLVHVSDIAIWREHIARKRNIPRRWVLPDELIVEISRREPMTTEELYSIRGVHEKLTSSMAHDIVEIVRRGKKSDPTTWPVKEKRRGLLSGSDATADVLMGLVRVRAKEHKVAPQLLATHDDLVALANGKRIGLDVLAGWRYDLVGRELVEVLEGREGLRFVEGKLSTVALEQAPEGQGS